MRSALNRLLFVASLVLAFAPGVALAWGGVHGLPQNLSLSTLTASSSVGTAALSVSGATTASAACATNYARGGLNFCYATNTLSGSAAPTVCTALAAPSANAIALLMYHSSAAVSQNAVGYDTASIQYYSDSGCTSNIAYSLNSIYEQVATAGAVTLLQISRLMFIRLPSAGATIYQLGTTTTGSNNQYQIFGYYESN